MTINKASHPEYLHDGWSERHPKASGALATLVTGAFTTVCAMELAKKPTVEKAIAAGALGAYRGLV